ncbi:BA75_03613T0 [Komagataella pastoris]|uniref:BA75_03613T0 n=1 Tax=Komagataella pastoris TaxID=4922 RepID=A0A1B2JES9_PICPA|nr:BA75_03613T0 [Komagataella pastoris]
MDKALKKEEESRHHHHTIEDQFIDADIINEQNKQEQEEQAVVGPPAGDDFAQAFDTHGVEQAALDQQQYQQFQQQYQQQQAQVHIDHHQPGQDQDPQDESAEAKIQHLIPKYTAAASNDLSHLNIEYHHQPTTASHQHVLHGHSHVNTMRVPSHVQHYVIPATPGGPKDIPILPEDDEAVFVTPWIQEKEFDDVTELRQFVKEFAKRNEFGIAIAHSNNKAIYFTCELGGSYREKKPRKDSANKDIPTKKVGSKKIKCPFSMVANYSKKHNKWTLKINQAKHNHPKLDPLTSFPMLRKRSTQVNQTIKDLYANGDKPSTIHQKLREIFPDLFLKREDIYNEIRILKKRKLVPSSAEIKSRKIQSDETSVLSNPDLMSHHQNLNTWSGISPDHHDLETNVKLAAYAQEAAKREAEVAAAQAAAVMNATKQDLDADEAKIDEHLINIDSRLH